MNPLGVCTACVVAALVWTPAAGQTIRAEDLTRFLALGEGRIVDSASTDWDDLLYVQARSGHALDVVLAGFAARIGVRDVVARPYAWVIVQSVLYSDACAEQPRDPDRCLFAPGRSQYERVAAIARRERTGKLLVAVGKTAGGTLQDEAGFLTLARSHPAAAAIFERLLEVKRDATYLLALAAAGPVKERAATIATANDLLYFRAGWSRQDDSWRLALIEAVEERAATSGASLQTRAALAQIALLWKLELGRIDEAITSYYAYPRGVRANLPLPMRACRAVAKVCARSVRYQLSDELAAALWLTGHRDEARGWLTEEIADFSSRERADVASLVATVGRYRALAESFAPTYDDADLFPLFVNGRLPQEPEPAPDRSGRIQIETLRGWMFQVRVSGKGVRRVVANRLRAAGYEEMAVSLEEPPERPRFTTGDPRLPALAAMYPPRVRQRREYWGARIAAAAGDGDGRPPAHVSVSTRDLPRWWIEQTLPPSIAAWRDTETPPKPPENASLPVDPDDVIRYEERDGERAIIYVSYKYELPVETAGPGLWFAQTVSGVWSRPLYLGLQQRFPYAATKGSRLPLLDGTHLRIEVGARAVDNATIRFPPVSRDLTRSADGLYLEFDLTTLAADRDGDGLTDIEERRVGLDFSNPDTDGDGVPDGRDPLPLVRYRPLPADENALAQTIVAQIFGGGDPQPLVTGVAPTLEEVSGGDPRDRAAVAQARPRFLIGDPAIFAGVSTRFRLMVYSPADIDALGTNAPQFYPFHPPRIWQMFSTLDGRTHYVEWSSSGGGGSFTVTCDAPGQPCSVIHLISYVT